MTAFSNPPTVLYSSSPSGLRHEPKGDRSASTETSNGAASPGLLGTPLTDSSLPKIDAEHRLVDSPTFAHPVVLIFRSNDVLRLVVPQLEARLAELGYEVRKIELPQGTRVEKIPDILQKQHREVIGSGVIFTDRTVKEHWGYGLPALAKCSVTIDEMLLHATGELAERILNINPIALHATVSRQALNGQAQQSIEHFGEAMVRLFKLALAENWPKKIVIFRDKLSDHPPFTNPHLELDAEDYIKDWLTRAGYPLKNILVVAEGLDRAYLNEWSRSKAKSMWFIADDHLRRDEGLEKMIKDVLEDAWGDCDDVGFGDSMRSEDRQKWMEILGYRLKRGRYMPPDGPTDRNWLMFPIMNLWQGLFQQELIKPEGLVEPGEVIGHFVAAFVDQLTSLHSRVAEIDRTSR